jgi:hypothetical protein
VNAFAAGLLGALAQVQNLVTAGVLAAFLALGVRGLTLPFLDRGRAWPITALRALGGLAFLSLGGLYALFTAHLVDWTARPALLAVAVALLVLAPLGVRHVLGPRRSPPRRPGLVGLLAQTCLLLGLLLLGAVTLMRAGFLALTADRGVLLVDVTGETAAQLVGWAAPDQPPRQERLRTHRVVFRTPEGMQVAEAWIYGDEVAVKGRVLRLSPLLSAAGVPNLFELQFAHNGYRSAERHATLPHTAVPLPASGPLAVHPWWRPLQARLLQRWEKGTAAESAWSVRSLTTESTYFALVDEADRPLRRTYRLVLTPGGLSSS